MAHTEEITEFKDTASHLMPLLLAFLAPQFPLPMLLLFAFSRIQHDEAEDRLPPGDPMFGLNQARARHRHAKSELQRKHDEATAARRASMTPEPWPQALPTSLPPFPAGWVRADPPGKSMVTRAYQLLQPLWLQGEGAKSTERDQVMQLWVTYVAEKTSDGRRGIVAYIIDKHPMNKPSIPGTRASNATKDGRPVLRQGSGMGALAAQQPYVIDVQTRLHVVPADGKFGSDTRTNVVRFQSQHGLPADGIVGPATWAQLDQVPDPRGTTAWNVQVGPAQHVQPA